MKAIVAETTPRWRVVFEIISTLAMLVFAAVFVWQGRGRLSSSPAREPVTVEIPKDPIKIGASSMRGSKSARLAIVEFADFKCPACARFSKNVEPALVRDYVDKGQLVIVFKNYPLPIHPEAKAAAVAGFCAGEQGKFWQARDWLFENTQHASLASALGLNVRSYDACLADPRSTERVESERVEADTLQVMATPTFFLGKLMPNGLVQVAEVIVGVESVERYKKTIDRLLQ